MNWGSVVLNVNQTLDNVKVSFFRLAMCSSNPSKVPEISYCLGFSSQKQLTRSTAQGGDRASRNHRPTSMTAQYIGNKSSLLDQPPMLASKARTSPDPPPINHELAHPFWETYQRCKPLFRVCTFGALVSPYLWWFKGITSPILATPFVMVCIPAFISIAPLWAKLIHILMLLIFSRTLVCCHYAMIPFLIQFMNLLIFPNPPYFSCNCIKDHHCITSPTYLPNI